MSREQAAGAAGDLVLRLRSLLGDSDCGSGSEDGGEAAVGHGSVPIGGASANGRAKRN